MNIDPQELSTLRRTGSKQSYGQLRKCTRFWFLYSLRTFCDENHEQLMCFQPTTIIVGFECLQRLTRQTVTVSSR